MNGIFRRVFLTYNGILFVLFCCFLSLTVYFYSLYNTKFNIDVSRENAVKASNMADSMILLHTNNLDVIADFCDDFMNLAPNFKNPDSSINKKLINNFLLDCLQRSHSLMPELPVSLYIIIEDRIYSPIIDTAKLKDRVKERPWYNLGLEHKRRVVATDVYTDIFSGNNIITLVKTLSHPNSMLIVDIQLNNLIVDKYFASIPDNNQIFVLDKNQKVIFYRDRTKPSYTHANNYIEHLFSNHKLEDFLNKGKAFNCAENNHTFIGYATQSKKNGYYTLILSDNKENYSVFKDDDHILIFLSTLALALSALLLVRETIYKLRIRTKANILMALGNIYNDIIYLNLKTQTFKNYKGHGPISFDIESNKYEDLFAILFNEVDDSFKDIFEKNFSMGAILHLAKDQRIAYDLDIKLKLTNDFESQWYRFTILFKDSRNAQEAVLCIRSIDIQKKQELKEQDLLKDAIESSLNHEKDRNNFLSAMSHEMRTPINGILGLCAIGKYSVNNCDKTKTILSKVEDISQQLLHIVNEILEASNIEAQSKLNLNDCNLENFLNKRLDMFTYMAQHQEKIFEINLDIRHKYVLVDEQKLAHILENLVSNAFKYSNVHCSIKVSVSELEDQDYTYMFIVEDNGIGMTQEFLKTVFTVYSRENRKAQVVGTGLGMPIVKNLINKMHGTIDIQSKVNEGTTITFALKLSPARCEINSDNRTQNSEEEVSFDGSMHVLVAEDNQLNLDIVTELLGMHNITVTGVPNGQKAFDAFYDNPAFTFDAILMDMRMPVLDGASATQLIRESDKDDSKLIPIIALTANTSTDDLVTIHNCGMNAHVAKPVNYNLLIKTIVAQKNKMQESIEI